MDNTKYYVVKKKAVPEVLIKVVETKRLLATRRGMTIQEATEEIGISEVLSINIRMIFSHFTKMKKEGLLRWLFSLMIHRGLWQSF